MSKKYTKKQILESIKHWEKQLRAGNYKKVNESQKKALCTLGDLVKRIKDQRAENCDIQWVEERPDGSAEIVFSRDAGAFDSINLSKDSFNESVRDMENRFGDPMHQVANDGSPVTVAQLHEMFDVLYDGQDRSPVNVGENGRNFGQVNSASIEDGKVVLTLAPYKNGRQSRDLSAGFTGPAISVSKLMQLVQSAQSDCEVSVKMKDPYGFGPRAQSLIEMPVIAIDVDSAYGIFFRLDS